MCGQRCKGLAARFGLERTSYKTDWLRRTVANPANAFGTVARSASILLSLRGCRGVDDGALWITQACFIIYLCGLGVQV